MLDHQRRSRDRVPGLLQHGGQGRPRAGAELTIPRRPTYKPRPAPGLRLGLALALLAVLVWASPALAVKLTGFALVPGPKATSLVITGDGPLLYQVSLGGPSTVLITIDGAELAAPLPEPGGPGGLVRGLDLLRNPDSLTIKVETNSPGITVLPLYEAGERRLTLELGGPPSLEVTVPAAEKAPARPQTASAEKPQDQGPAPGVTGIRLGSHPAFTRLVIDADGPLTATFKSRGRKAELGFSRAYLLPPVRRDAPDERVTEIKVAGDNPIKLELALAHAVKRHRLFYLDEGNKAVLDLYLYPPGQEPAEAPPEPAPESEPKPAPAAKQSATAPAPKPAEQKQAAPAEPEPDTPSANYERRARLLAKSIPMASPAKPTGEPGRVRGRIPPVPPPPALAHPREAAEPAADLSQARPLEEALAKGRAPLPRPADIEPPAAPADQAGQAAAPGAAPGTAGGALPGAQPPAARQAPPDLPATDQGRVLARLKAVRTGQPGVVKGALPQLAPAAPPASPDKGRDKGALFVQTVQDRPPQAAQLGPQAREDKDLAKLFQTAKLDLEDRRYDAALRGFSLISLKHPKSQLAPEASYRMGDAYFFQHERNILPVYDQVMEYYQRAIDLYPASDQVPWALLMMGKASMLNEEAYKALGYFELVIQDFPQSEYVPLALVERGRAFLNQGKWGRALDEFRDVTQKYPDSRYRKDAEWGQSQALFALARFERASLLLQDMNKRYPDLHVNDPELLYYIGEAEFQLRDYAKARNYFLWVLNIMPGIRDADIVLTRVGDTYKFEGDHKAAQDVYKTVVNTFPDSDGALVSRIRLAESPEKDPQHPWDIFQVKATTDAQKTYKEIVEKYPQRQVADLAMLKLGVYYYKTKEYDKALSTLEGLLREHPGTTFRSEASYTMNLAAQGKLAVIRAADKPMDLMNTYLQLRPLLKQPNSNENLQNLAWAYANSGLPGRAANLYKMLINRGLDQPDLVFNLAANQYADGDYAGVTTTLSGDVLSRLSGEKALAARSYYGRALVETGDYARGSQVLAALVEQSPQTATADDYASLGTARAELKQPKEAVPDLLKAAEMLEGKPEPAARLKRYLVLMRAGREAHEAGDHSQAAACFAKAKEAAPTANDQCQALYGQAQCLDKAGRKKEMVEALKELVKMNMPPWAQMAEGMLQDMKLSERLSQVGK